MKKIISLVLVLAVVFSVMAGTGINANALNMTIEQVASTDGFKPGTPRSDLNCKTFCNAVWKMMYGLTLGSQKSNKIELDTGSGNYQIGSTLSYSSGNLNNTNVSNLLSQSIAGDVIQLNSKKYNNLHALMIFSNNGNSLVIYDCIRINGQYTIRQKSYSSYSSFANGWFNYSSGEGISLYRSPKNVKATPQNIGTNFYAFIIKQDTWHHITNVNGNVQLAKANNSFHGQQIWKFIRQSNGSYKIVNQYDGTCLDAAGASDWNGVNVQSYADNNTNAQRWNVYKSGNGYCLKPVYSNRCLDVLNNSDAAGTNVQLYDSNGSGAQVFSIYNVKNDGVTFSKPAKPAKVTPKVSVSGINVKVTWNKSALKNKYDSRTYTVNIYKDKVDNSHLVHQKTGISGTSYSFSHNKNGTFYIKVYAVNKYFKSWHTASSSVKFKITKACSSHSYKQTVSTTATTKRDGVLKKVCTKCGYTTTSTIYQISDVSINNYKFTYTGSSIKPTVKITDRNGKTLGSSDYSVNYPSGNTSVGKHDYQIKFKDKYSGTYNAVFTIYPRATRFTKGEKNKSQIRLTWNKGTSEIDGYRILRSTNSDFSNAKVSYPSKSTTQKTWSNLSSGTKYYFKIQTYKEVNGTKYLSSSHIVSVTTKS